MRLILATAFFTACVFQTTSRADDASDFGLMLNEDGDVVFAESLGDDPAAVEAKLRANLDSLLSTGVETLVFNIACGSDIMHYPTDVGSRWGWRTVEKENAEPWATYLPAMRALTEQGLDSVRIAGEWCRDRDMRFVPSYRINDSHYAHDYQENPLTGRFYLENKHLELGASPVAGNATFARLLNFEHAEARQYRLDVIREVIDRHGDLIDGFMIDFLRQPILFPPGRAEAGAPYVTEFVREVRRALDAASAKSGRELPLIVRVPTSLRACGWVGLDVAAWASEGLIDVVIPAATMTLNHDVDYRSFAALTSPDGGPVVGGTVLPRTQFTWQMTATPDAASYSGTGYRETTPAHVRGAVMNARAGGAEVIEFYNINLPLSDAGRALVDAAAAPRSGPRIYAVTPAYYLDHTHTYEDRKQVPATLSPGDPQTLTLTVGESISSTADVHLRFGLRGIAETDRSLSVTLNGHDLGTFQLDADSVLAVTGTRSRPSSLHPADPDAYLQMAVDPKHLRRGENTLKVDLLAAGVRAVVEVVEVQLAVFGQGIDD